MRITSSGNLLIGTTTDAGYKLDVNGTGRFSGVLTSAVNVNAGTLELGTSSLKGVMNYSAVSGLWKFNNQSAGSVSTDYYQFQADGTPVLTIKKSGAATFSNSVTASSFFVSSDITLKSLTAQTFDASKIDAISYKWKTDLQGKTLVGYSAQDVQKYMPDAVNTDSNGKLSVDYIQVLVQKIAHLETELKSLKNGLE
jgi:hypothetical protein